MKETVVVDKEMLMKLLRAFAGNYDFEMCEFCTANRNGDCIRIRSKDGCAGEVFKKLTEVESRGEEICNYCKHGPVTTGASSCLILSCYGYSKFDPVANTPLGIRNKAEDIHDSLIW